MHTWLKTLGCDSQASSWVVYRAVESAPILAVQMEVGEVPLEIRRTQLAAILGTSSRPTKAAPQLHRDHVISQRSSCKKVTQQSFPFGMEPCRNCVGVTNNLTFDDVGI